MSNLFFPDTVETSCKQSPLGTQSVHLGEVFSYGRLKMQNLCVAGQWQSVRHLASTVQLSNFFQVMENGPSY